MTIRLSSFVHGPTVTASDPLGSLTAHMGVIVTSKYSKSGSQISRDMPHSVIVKTNAGYATPGTPARGPRSRRCADEH